MNAAGANVYVDWALNVDDDYGWAATFSRYHRVKASVGVYAKHGGPGTSMAAAEVSGLTTSTITLN